MKDTLSSLAEFQSSLNVLQQDIQTHRATNNRAAEAESLTNLGHLYRSQRKPQEAIAAYEAGLKLFQSLQKLTWVAESWRYIGAAFTDLQQWSHAAIAFSSSYQSYADQQNTPGMAQALNNLGVCYRHQSLWEDAIVTYKKSLTLKRQLQDLPAIGRTLGNLGELYIQQQQWQAAIQVYSEAVQIFMDLDDHRRTLGALLGLASACQHQKLWLDTIATYQKCLILCDRQKDAKVISAILKKIEQFCQESLPQVEKDGDTHAKCGLLSELGSVYREQGKYIKAIESYEKSLKLCRELQNDENEGTILFQLGLLQMLNGQPEIAVSHFQESLMKLPSDSELEAMVKHTMTQVSA